MTGGASFCWVNDEPAGRNTFALMVRRLRLDAPPQSAALHLFADTRYRLLVNGATIGFGPARFHPARPEYDTYDLAPHLRAGVNRIVVEVWSAQSVNFQSITAPAAFWTDGEIVTAGGERLSLASPGEWTGFLSSAREPHAVPLSFAIGPVEILDAECLAREREEDGTPLVRVQTSHGEPSPRSIPMPVPHVHHPVRILRCGEASTGGERRFGAFRFFPDFVPRHAGGLTTRDALCAAWLFSPEDRTIPLGLFWSGAFLNGVELDRRDVPGLGNRQTAQARFRKGWNFLIARLPVLGEVWGFPLALPAECECAPRVAPAHDAPTGFLMTPRLEPEGQPFPKLDGCMNPPEGVEWVTVPADSIGLAPAREVGWDFPVGVLPPPQFVSGREFQLRTGPDGVAILTLEFDTEFLGHPAFDVSCAQACTVDVSTGEFLREDGAIDVFKGLFSVHVTDRYLIPPGGCRVEGFHNRGGRYLQFNIRAAPGTGINIAGPEIREFKTPPGNESAFECGDDFLNWCWAASEKTMNASLEDIWSDSPWREQGCYLGDSLVQFHAHICMSPDMRLPARILRLWAQCQRPDGQLPAVMPAHMTTAHPDFTLLYIKFVRDYWAHTGDAALVGEVWPAVKRLLASPTWITTGDGLITTNGGRLFIDWSVESNARLGASSVLNALFLHALDCAAELAPVAGEDPGSFLQRRAALYNAFQRHLWNDADGRYLCTILDGGERVAGRALHGNALAWAWGLAAPEQRERILPWLLAELDDNARKIVRQREAQPKPPRDISGQLEPYFLFYLLGPLAEAGHAKAAEGLVADMWGLMRERGAVTLWESVLQTYFDQGSRCHSWAVAPLIYASRFVLGVRRPTPGKPDHLRIQPLTARTHAACGIAPHPRGPVRVAWRREGKRFTLDVVHPPGLNVEILPPPDIDPRDFHPRLTVSV